jgi:molybdopterin-binding protein
VIVPERLADTWANAAGIEIATNARKTALVFSMTFNDVIVTLKGQHEIELFWYKEAMGLSARNQLPGTVEEVHLGEIMAHVVVKVGDNLVESVITRTSAEELALKKGDAVRVVVKSTEVMIQKG